MHIENLEQRRYFALGTGVITINGTDNADNLQLTQSGSVITLTNLTSGATDVSSGTVTQIIVNLNGGNDFLRLQTSGGANIVTVAVSVTGGNGNDTIIGGSGNDTLRGQDGADFVQGGNGNDRIAPGTGLDDIDGQGGSDTIDYSAYVNGVAVSLDGVQNDGTKGDATDSDHLHNFENILGGAGNDTLIGGDNQANAIDGGGGNDAIAGRSGNDTLTGGTGIDTIWGEDGNDSLFAKDGISDGINDGAGTDAAQIDTSPADTATSATPAQAAAAALMAKLSAMGFEAVALGDPGDLDPNFGSEGVSLTSVNGGTGIIDVTMQGDKILMLGTYPDPTLSDNDIWLFRLNSDGSLDTTFGDSDGEGGHLGYTHADFGTFERANDTATALTLDDSGDIIVAGYTQENTNENDYALARYSSDGVLDDSFGSGGKVTVDPSDGGADELYDVLSAGTDGYVVLARTNNQLVQLDRFDGNGAYMGQFSNVAFFAPNQDPQPLLPVALARDAAGNYIMMNDAGRETSSERATFDAFDSTGQWYTNGGGVVDFGTDYTFSVQALAIRGERAVVTGILYAGDAPSGGGVAALDLDFTGGNFSLTNKVQNTVFHSGGDYLEFYDVAFDADNRAVAVGADTWSSQIVAYRFNTDDATADSTFRGGSGPATSFGPESVSSDPGLVWASASNYSGATAVAVQGDGMIVAAGNASSFSENNYAAAVRFLGGDILTGPPELDTTFNPDGNPPGTDYLNHSGLDAYIYDSTTSFVDGEDKTYLAGSMLVGSLDQMFVIRLNEDGSIDHTWGQDLGEGYHSGYITLQPDTSPFLFSINDVQKLQVLADGKVLLYGTSTTITGGTDYSQTLLAELNADGSVDTGFGDDDTSDSDPSTRLGYTFLHSGATNNDTAVDMLVKTDGSGNVAGIYTVASSMDSSDVTTMTVGLFNADGTLANVHYASDAEVLSGSADPVAAAFGVNGDVLVLARAADGQGSEIYSFDPADLSITGILTFVKGDADFFTPTDFAVDVAGHFYIVGDAVYSESSYGGVIYGVFTNGGSGATYSDPASVYGVEFTDVTIDASGSALIAGTDNDSQLVLYRTASLSEQPDYNFGANGLVYTPVAAVETAFSAGISIDSHGRAVIGGYGDDFDNTPYPLAARYIVPNQVAEDILTDQDVQNEINNGELKWYDDNGNPVGNLGNYFTYRISDPNVQNGVLNLFGDNQSGGAATSLAADDITVGNPQDDYFEIGRRFDENGVEYFWVRRSHNENDEGETRQYGIDELTGITIDGGSGHTKVVIDNALGVPLHITGEEDNVEVIVKTTLFGDPNSGSARTLDSATDPSHGSTLISNNQITYTPDANYNGDDSFSYTESHPSAGDDSGTIDITLTPVNDAPTGLTLTPAAIQENKIVGTQVGLFSTTDVDDTTGFTYELVSGAGSTDNGSFDIIGGALVSKASFNYEAKQSYSVRVRVTDPGGAAFDKIFTISILNVAEKPTANPGGPYTVATGGSIVLNGSGTDPDANTTLTYKWDFDNDGVFGEASTAYGNENGAAPTFTATGLASGTVFNVKFKVTDNTGLSDTKTVGINIASVHEFTGTVIGTTPNANSNSKEKAFDGKLNTYFYGANTSGGAWVGLDMGTKQQVTQIKFAPAFGGTANMVGGRFQASNDANFASGVVTIYTITTAPVAGALTTVTANTPGSYRYYRYIGPSGGVTQVAEIEFYGPTDQTSPSKPGKPFTTSIGLTSIALKWTASTDNVGVNHYDIFRNGTKVGSSPTNTFTDTGLNPNTAYTYTVQAIDANGNVSPLSDALSVSTHKDTTNPSKPTNLHAGTVTTNSIQLLWNASTDNVAVAYYIVYRNGKQVGTTTSLSFTSTGLTTKTNYTFTVQAVDTSGNLSLMSDAIVIKTL